MSQLLAPSVAATQMASLDYLVGNLDEPFSATLLKLIDSINARHGAGGTDVDHWQG